MISRNFLALDGEPAYDDPVVQVVAQVHVVQANHPLLVGCLRAGGVTLHVLLLSLVNNGIKLLTFGDLGT